MDNDCKLLAEKYTKEICEAGYHDHELHDLRKADPRTNPWHKCDSTSCIPDTVATLTPIITKQVNDLLAQGYNKSEAQNIIDKAMYQIILNLFHGGRPRLM